MFTSWQLTIVATLQCKPLNKEGHMHIHAVWRPVTRKPII